MKTVFNSVTISGVAAAVPIQTHALQSIFSHRPKSELLRIMETTGVTHVRVAPALMRTSDLCEVAAKKLLEILCIPKEEIDAIVFVSQTPDDIMPATSVSLQHRLGLSTTVLAFDLHYGCSGYIYGLYQAALLLQSTSCRHVLVCAGDVITPLLHPDDHQVRMVFGDGGSATLLSKGEGTLDFSIKSDGAGTQHLSCEFPRKNPEIAKTPFPGYLYMNGTEIMAFALREVPAIIQDVLEMKTWKKEEVDVYLFHQANKFMLNYLAKKMRIPLEALPVAMQTLGNLGSASIPTLLVLEGNALRKIKQLNKVIMCGFGVGLSWGAVALSLENTVLLPLIEI